MSYYFYQFFIYPLEFIFDISYEFFFRLFHSPFFALAGVSTLITLLTLPLYNLAEKQSQEERSIQNKMKAQIARIKKTFTGDEQYMMLMAYYSENHYHPIMALRSSIGIIIQIPFFIAAYHFLSNLESLNGQGFFWIKDFSKPDSLYKIGTLQLNVLPVLMTVINIFASSIYTKGFSLKEKMPIYITAIIFLVLLYTSPSGLVIYWTMNNVYSLVKNIINKTKNPLRSFYFLCTTILFITLMYVLFIRSTITDISDLPEKLICLFTFLLVTGIPFFVIKNKTFFRKTLENISIGQKHSFILFLTSIFGLSLLLGLVLPANVISSSPQEFSNILKGFENPVKFVFTSLLFFSGLFGVWCGLFYFLLEKSKRWILSIFSALIFAMGLLDAFVFFTYIGTLTPMLEYVDFNIVEDSYNAFVRKMQFPYFITVVVLFVVFLTLLKKSRLKLLSVFYSIICLSLVGMGVVKIKSINTAYSALEKVQNSQTDTAEQFKLCLSKTGQNVILILCDRAINWYFPYVVEQFPKLEEQYKGFTYFPNTISFSGSTNGGILPIYGGYEYTPKAIFERKRSPNFKEYWNEGTKVIPKIFSDVGLKSYLLDTPTFSDVSSDPKVFADIPNTMAFNGEKLKQQLKQKFFDDRHLSTAVYASMPARFISYSLFLIAPLHIRMPFYDSGEYFCATRTPISSMDDFLTEYAELEYLPNLFSIENNNAGTYCMVYNSTPHHEAFLSSPNYDIPSSTKTGDTGSFSVSSTEEIQTYQVNAATILKLGSFFDYLRKEGVYDNTKIIIVADHGYTRKGPFSAFSFKENNIAGAFNPLLLVKDFNAFYDIQTDNTFMTNADIPYIATQHLFSDGKQAKNPYSNETLHPSRVFPYYVYDYSGRWGGKRFVSFDKVTTKADGFEIYDISNNISFEIGGNIFNQDNWKKIR
ncbi:membrane protein insertase YidC [Treponema ruminis]|uniref:YidC/Oxa1 family membrane protein insertase n=1 Tax=Treponema ruminis TaxID=744515 RepID=A0A7W8LLA9_9SPIR|nr:membrane protein insertase YidC [Treponema ruminis]MBB5225256.1 YidC/Oxa1 family membrane protein insertase [Treponema ruminis]QSI01873.1 membrane protein insertase YidC [Treponema ruminis]